MEEAGETRLALEQPRSVNKSRRPDINTVKDNDEFILVHISPAPSFIRRCLRPSEGIVECPSIGHAAVVVGVGDDGVVARGLGRRIDGVSDGLSLSPGRRT